MRFIFDGREFDTDKRVFVLGYAITKTWFWFDVNSDLCRNNIRNYKPAVKAAYITSVDLNAEKINGHVQNRVIGFHLDIPSGGRGELKVRDNCIVGRSAQECMRLYKERTTE